MFTQEIRLTYEASYSAYELIFTDKKVFVFSWYIYMGTRNTIMYSKKDWEAASGFNFFADDKKSRQ